METKIQRNPEKYSANPASRTTNNAGELQRIIDGAIARRRRAITIPPGTYYCANPIVLAKVHDLALNGEGVHIIMTDRGKSGFIFHNCAGITMKGFSIDYDPLPFTQATVVARNAEATEFEFEIHEGYPGLTGLDYDRRAEVFDSKTMLWKMAPGFGPGGDLYYIERRALSSRRGFLKIKTPAPSFEPGDYFALISRERDFIASAIEFKHCSTVRLEDLVILASPSMAVYCVDMDGENYFSYTIKRGPQGRYGVGRLISANADGLHYHGGRRGPIINRCDFSFMGDDSVNINGPAFVIKELESPQVLWIEANEFNAACLSSAAEGDTIRFMNAENFDIVAEARIASISNAQVTDEVTDARLRRYTSGAGPLFKRGYIARMACATPVQLSGNEYCNIFELNCPGFTVRNSCFHDHRAYGMRIFGTDGIIENNRIERAKAAAIVAGPGFYGAHDGWGKNITIRGNTINDIPFASVFHQGAISVSAFELNHKVKCSRCARDITIENNTVTDCGASGIFINAADGVRIQGNRLCRTNKMDCSPFLAATDLKAEYAIDAQNAAHVSISDNTVVEPGKFCAGDVRPCGGGLKFIPEKKHDDRRTGQAYANQGGN